MLNPASEEIVTPQYAISGFASPGNPLIRRLYTAIPLFSRREGHALFTRISDVGLPSWWAAGRAPPPVPTTVGSFWNTYQGRLRPGIKLRLRLFGAKGEGLFAVKLDLSEGYQWRLAGLVAKSCSSQVTVRDSWESSPEEASTSDPSALEVTFSHLFSHDL